MRQKRWAPPSPKNFPIDPVRQPIPVAPAEHYHMGGLWTDAKGRTSFPGLWAAGEAASTGLHGANRLASNSLLEAVVFGDRVAKDIARDIADPSPSAPSPALAPAQARQSESDGKDARHLREIMTRYVGVLRNEVGLRAALVELKSMHDRARTSENLDLRNRTEAAMLVAASAYLRRESRGGHFRTDYPKADPAQARRSVITLDEALRLAQSLGRKD
jgi:L-aspartate oxidase